MNEDTIQKRLYSDGTIRICAKDRKKNYKVRLEMLNGNKNRNNWVYENIEKHLEEFADIPILYSVIGNKVANSHDFEVKTDPKTGKKYASFIGATSEHMAGWIVRTINGKENVRIENIDGVEWVVAEGIFPTFYNKEFLDEMEANGNQMSVSIETIVTKSRVVDDVEYEEEWEVVGVTVLGRGVTEAVAGANIRAASLSVDGIEELRLRAASYYEHSSDNTEKDDKGATKTNNHKKEQNKMIFNKDDLAVKFNGYSVLGTNGSTVALLSENGRFYAYTFAEGEETVVPERIRENAVSAKIGDGEETVSISGEQIVSVLVGKLNAAKAANEVLAAEREDLKRDLDAMKEAEIKRRKNAVKIAGEKRLEEINASMNGIALDECKDLFSEEKIAEYAEAEKCGEFCGEELICKDIDARCMSKMLSAKKTERKQFAWDVEAKGESKPAEGTFESVLAKYDK